MGSFVSTGFRARIRGGIEPIARLFGRVGLTPNALTLIGFAIAVLGAAAAASQQWLFAGLLVAFGAIFDLFDGALARATGKTSRLGAFLDSTFDRLGELVVYIGIIGGALFVRLDELALVAATAMAAAVMVSYIRAKSESLGFSGGTGIANVGFAPREVRIVILAVGLVLAGNGPVNIVPAPPTVCIDSCIQPGGTVLLFTLGLIAILATITTVQRIVHVVLQSRKQEN
jgi:CDP-diacylglycerol---glycerol-3-phosphate 3-phosphatidyltransferase